MTGWTSTRGEWPGMELVIAGKPPARAGAHAELVLILATYAAALGFSGVGVETSRIPWSSSRYLVFVDMRRQPWKMRISDHEARARKRRAHDLPHFDLVSRDGVSGLDRAKAWMDTVAAGKAQWVDLSILKPRKRKPAASPRAWRDGE